MNIHSGAIREENEWQDIMELIISLTKIRKNEDQRIEPRGTPVFRFGEGGWDWFQDSKTLNECVNEWILFHQRGHRQGHELTMVPCDCGMRLLWCKYILIGCTWSMRILTSGSREYWHWVLRELPFSSYEYWHLDPASIVNWVLRVLTSGSYEYWHLGPESIAIRVLRVLPLGSCESWHLGPRSIDNWVRRGILSCPRALTECPHRNRSWRQ